MAKFSRYAMLLHNKYVVRVRLVFANLMSPLRMSEGSGKAGGKLRNGTCLTVNCLLNSVRRLFRMRTMLEQIR